MEMTEKDAEDDDRSTEGREICDFIGRNFSPRNTLMLPTSTLIALFHDINSAVGGNEPVHCCMSTTRRHTQTPLSWPKKKRWPKKKPPPMKNKTPKI